MSLFTVHENSLPQGGQNVFIIVTELCVHIIAVYMLNRV